MTERASDRVLEALRRSDCTFRPNPSDPTRWTAQCPAHDDREPSLSIREAEVGREGDRGVLLHCHAGCGKADVVAALGLELADLYDGECRTNGNGRHAARAKRAKLQANSVRPMTDLGNAERLVTAHLHEIRYAPGIGWLAWDGRRWRRDTSGAVVRCAKQTVRRMYEEASRLEDADARKELVNHAKRSESEARIKAMIALAESEEPVVVPVPALDAEPFSLNVENGTIDLRTGELREHRREDLITKLAPVEYDPEATDAAWAYFLQRTTGGDAEFAGFVQRAAGYTLTGDTSEEKLFFPHGPEATGKTTLLEPFKAMLGDYAATADFESFIAKRGDSGPRPDIARLMGARLVLSVEVDEGKRLAEGLVKQLTGGDTVTARHLYRDSVEFRPTFKLWLAANSRPRVRAEDGALWRRIVQIPFVEQVPEQERDPHLKGHLKTDAGARSAILAWAVRGCLEWQRDGLDVPERVRDYTADYRRENDPVAEWIDECCLLEPSSVVRADALRSSYEQFAERNGEKAISAKALGDALAARRLTRTKHDGRRAWRGIELQGQDR